MPDIAAECERKAESIQFDVETAIDRISKLIQHIDTESNAIKETLKLLNLSNRLSDLRTDTRKAVHLWKDEKDAKKQIDELEDFLNMKTFKRTSTNETAADTAIRLLDKAFPIKTIKPMEIESQSVVATGEVGKFKGARLSGGNTNAAKSGNKKRRS